ncbi:repeat protein, partial [Gardnerella vaginalis JCP8151A]
GGGALDSTSVKPSESINSSNSNETEKTNETTKYAKSAKTSESVTDTENFETNKITQTLIDVSNTNLPTSNRGSINVHESAESREALNDSSSTNDASLTWTRDDFNISADGKTVGGRKDVYHPETNETVNEYVDGLSAKGKEKLKKNHHIVIPEGIEVIHECAFTGSAKQVGNKHEHIDGETYIEGVTLPQSLKIIEYGAFGWNKIKGTVVIPKNVISVSNAAFVANEIEKVVFEGVIDGTGKEHDTDADPYYLAGVGSVAFQGNKISEIVVKGNLGQYKFRSGENDSPFDNQNPGPFTIEVGEEYKRPITITQESSGHTISVMEGFEENGNPVTIDRSPYFKKNSDGKYVAVKTGTLEGQCIFYDFVNNMPRMIGRSHFTYNIIPKAKIYTVTFVNGNNSNYASVQVKEGKSISENSVAGQMMPSAPSKEGYTFVEWNADSTGKDKSKIFTDQTPVKSDMTVYAIYTPKPAPAPIPTPVPKPTPTPDTTPDTDEEQTPAPDSTPITDFVPSHVQEYTKNQDYSFDVKKQDEAPLKMQIQANSAKHLPETGSSVTMAMNSLFASVFAGIFVLVGARKSLRSYSKHARKN